MTRVAVAGAGLVGPVAALFLARRGYQVDLYERERCARDLMAGAGRSINLTLCTRGLAALERIGMTARVRRLTVPAYGRAIHAADGSSRFDPYGSRGEALYVIARAAERRAARRGGRGVRHRGALRAPDHGAHARAAAADGVPSVDGCRDDPAGCGGRI